MTQLLYKIYIADFLCVFTNHGSKGILKILQKTKIL